MKDKMNPMKNKFLNLLYSIFLVDLVYLLIKQLIKPYGLLSWGVSEFLINYQTGFVRRGLLGEILFCTVKYTGFNVELIVKSFCLICFGYLIYFFVKSFLNKGYSFYILPLCFFLGAPILGNFWLRKDCWMMCSLIIIIKLFLFLRKKSLLLSILLVNIGVVFVLLSHEVFIFFSLPIFFFLFVNLYIELNKNIYSSIILSLFSLLPIFIFFFLVTSFHGNSHDAQLIWNSWCTLLNIDCSDIGVRNSIGAIGWSTSDALNEHLNINFSGDNGIFSILFWLIITPTVYYIATNAVFLFKKTANFLILKDRTILSSIIIFQFICLLPVFLFLSCDYMRLFFYWISSSFIIFLLVPTQIMQTLFPPKYYEFTSRLNIRMVSFIYPTKGVMVILMLFVGIPAVGFQIISIYSNAMIYQIFYLISKPLFILGKLIGLKL